ncbi:MAG TPA: polysaccharide biosynthesis tyrosine autokinase [Hyphomicrobiaceae bacterium]|nr:polysaccharide biosynthesis tyrosine autokinase [Hyphomicrobiaceae bacterium]
MLKPADHRDECIRAFPQEPAAPPEDSSDLDRMLAAARRQLRLVLGCCLLSLFLGFVYVANTVPSFTADAALLIDYRRLRALHDGPDMAGLDHSGAEIDSQVELLRSNRLAFAVIDKLQLQNDPEFGKPSPGLVARLRAALHGGSAPPTDENDKSSVERRQRLSALSRFQANLDVRRVQRTLVLEIRFKSIDAAKAARIANAVADAYLTDQLNSKYEATQRASTWLLDRLAELKQQVLTSDLAIQKFRADNDLISAGGKLIGEQQLGEVNTQLVAASAETAKAEARYARIKSIIDNRKTDAVVTEAIGNTTIDQLRLKFLAAAKRESDLAPKLGPTHAAVAAARMEMRQYERLMFEELGRIAEGYLSDLVIARSKEESLRKSLKSLVGGNATANETAVALRELEREAESYRTLYQSFLQRYQEAVQHQSFPITEARVVSSALVPTAPSHPRKTLVLALALLIGGAVGTLLGALRELRDRAFRTEEQVRDELGLELLGMLPLVDEPKAAQERTDALLPEPLSIEGDAKGGSTDRLRRLPSAPGMMRYTLDHPLSNYAEILRGIKLAADLTLAGHTPRVIGAVSVLPSEGKSTVAKNLASLLAHQGARTLLVDADLRNPGLTRAVAPDAEAGLVQAVMAGTPIRDLVHCEPDSNLAVLPAVLQRRLPHAAEFLASSGMRSVLRQARETYHWIVLDLPPLGPVIDARAIVGQVDAFVLVVEWGRTTRRLVRATLDADRHMRAKCLGVVLNKVNLKQLQLYDACGSSAYYNGEYSRYYHEGR